jgi:regulator of sigma E protease
MTVLYGLLILDLIVFIHELGHFAAAKISGVYVESFSIGMGPVLIHHRFKGTDWRLSLFPIGGYCGMKGESDFQNACEARLNTIHGDTDSLYGKHPLWRLFIAAAGPVANIIFAFAAYLVIALTGYTYYAASAQIQLADELYPAIHSAARDGGLRTGDIVTTIDGKKIEDFSDLYEQVATHPDETMIFTVLRDRKNLTFTIHTTLDTSSGAGKIGVLSVPDTVKKREIPPRSVIGAVQQGVYRTGATVSMTIKGIATLFKGVKISQAVSGPARITTMLGSTVQEGFSAGFKAGLTAMLEFIALINVSLFLMNLLPVPVLDGGLILFSFLEAVFHIRISPRLRYVTQYIGLAFIIVLFIIASAGDIQYFMESAHAQ